MLYFFDELPPEAGPKVGGKGSVLARLYQRRYPVPNGFVITVDAFSEDDLKPEAWVQVQASLARMRQRIPGLIFCIRSSALSEDSAQASFAGEFESVLNVESDADILSAIRTVRVSAKSERVQAYLQAQGINTFQPVAVVVQEFIRADYAGVIFTADPVSGNLMHMSGNFVRGGGEKLVSGEANAQPFTFQRPRGSYQGPPELKPYARRLYNLCERLDRDSSAPQDIEWVIAGGKVSIVQSRPISSLRGFNPATGEWNDSLRGDFLWSNGNAAEIQPDVMPLLTATIGDLWGQGYGEWWSDRYRASGCIGGRLYFNITVQVAPFTRLPGMNVEKLVHYTSQWWGRIPAEVKVPLMPYSLWKTLSGAVPTYLRSVRRMTQQRKRIPEFVAKSPSWCRNLRPQIKAVSDPLALAALWRDEIMPFYTFGTAMASVANADNRLQLEAKLAKLVGEADANALVSNLGGTEFLDSLGPVVNLQKVAQGEISRETYLETYGHRCPNEFNIIYPQPLEDPQWLDEQLSRLAQSPVDVEGLLNKQRSNFAAAWERLAAKHPKKVDSIRKALDKTAHLAAQREAARSEATRVMGVIRLWALRAGELLDLKDNGIFHLTLEEVLGALAGDMRPCQYIPARRGTYERYRALPPYPPIISGRFDPFAWAADANRRSDLFDAHLGTLPPPSDPKVIVGFAGAAGVVEGKVRVLEHAADGHLLESGEVLVTTTTNVGWTPLFPRAAAVVTDVGAPLSHAAVVARELGVPAVVGCTDATSRLKTGDWVRVDGLKGTVQILEGKN